jgi:predicted CXXCH cytochrome family protein
MRRPWSIIVAVTFSALLWVTALGASSTPPQDQGSKKTYVGSDTCAECHDQVVYSVHGRLAEFERWGTGEGCESCHGPGSLHIESTEPSDIGSFLQLPAEEAAALCTNCHQHEQAMHWAGSIHAMNGLTCVDCHEIHKARDTVEILQRNRLATFHQNAQPTRGLLKAPEAKLCFECHQNVIPKMQYPSHHPVREGFMSCSSCHQVHGNTDRLVRTDERVNDLCYECHTQYQGPYIFEHAPVEEDCLICHDPHGSVANNLLRQNEPFLCLQCHETHFHTARVAKDGPHVLPSGSATNANGTLSFISAFGSKCSQCHIQIHGSDLPSQAISGRGGAFTR